MRECEYSAEHCHWSVPNCSAGSVRVIGVNAGSDHTCALTSNGGLWCWGYNYYSQLGVNNTFDQYSPMAVHLGTGKSRCLEWSMMILDVQRLLLWWVLTSPVDCSSCYLMISSDTLTFSSSVRLCQHLSVNDDQFWREYIVLNIRHLEGKYRILILKQYVFHAAKPWLEIAHEIRSISLYIYHVYTANAQHYVPTMYLGIRLK